jgi:hypothetical protein
MGEILGSAAVRGTSLSKGATFSGIVFGGSIARTLSIFGASGTSASATCGAESDLAEGSTIGAFRSVISGGTLTS